MNISRKASYIISTVAVAAPQIVYGATFVNPLKSGLGSFTSFMEALLRMVVYIAFPVAILFMVYSGFLFVFAQGNETQLTKAKKNFFWTLIGVTLLLGSWALASLIKGTIDPILR